MTGPRARILIVDDNPEDVAVYSRWLRTAPGRDIEIRTAASLRAAIDACEPDPPDCLLLDYDLRDATGLEVISELERRGVRPAIVAITGHGSETIAVDFMRSGAGDYLIKSQLSANGLRAAVELQLAKRADRGHLERKSEAALATNEELTVALERASFLARPTGQLDFEATLSAAATDAVPFLADICTIDVIRAGRLRRCAVHIGGEAPAGPMRLRLFRHRSGETTSFEAAAVMRTGVAAYVSGRDFSAAARHDADLELFAQAGMVAAAIVPLRRMGLTMGLMTFGTRTQMRFAAPERPLLAAYAQRVAAAIASADAAASDLILQEDALQTQSRLTFAHHISSLLARASDWEPALPRLMKALTASFSDAAAIFSVDGRTRGIQLTAAGSRTSKLEAALRLHYAGHPPSVEGSPGSRSGAQNANRIELRSADGPFSTGEAVWELCVPLTAGGAVIGVLVLLRAEPRHGFGRPDVALAQSIGRQISTLFASAIRYQHQHGIATALQAALRPSTLPVVADVRFAFRYIPGSAGTDVGGDWYDVVDVNPRRMVITIGDVTGLGVKAAAVMGQYRDIMRAYAFERFGPSTALARLNDIVNAQGGDQFATCAIVLLDREARRVRYALAGHPPPLLRLPDGTVQILDAARSMPIGAWVGTAYAEASVDVPPGSTLLMYTDGLVESRVRSASDGIDLLIGALQESRADIELMLDDVLVALAPGHSDDIAVLAIELLQAPSASVARWAFAGSDRASIDVVRRAFDTFFGVTDAASPSAGAFGSRAILDELLANLVQHAPGPFRLELDWTDDAPVLQLDDNGPGLLGSEPLRQPADPYSEHGRGLYIIDQLGRNLSIVARPSGGRTTRITLPLSRAAAGQPLTALSTMEQR